MNRPILFLLGALTAILAGCQQTPDEWISRSTPPMTPPTAFTSPELADVRRVALLPIWGDEGVRDREIDMVAAATRRSLQTLNAFEVVLVPSTFLNHRYGETAFPTTVALPPDLFEDVRHETDADAILSLEITSISSYPPLALGLKARLESLEGEGTLWAFDHFFDANQAPVAAAAKRYSAPSDPSSGSILLSPSLFADFVTMQMAETMRTSSENRRNR